MPNLIALGNNLDTKTSTCRIVIDTPKGSRNKYAYDPDSGQFELRALLPAGMVFPFDFGFIPGTLGGDGDPVDVMVLMDEPTHAGCVVQVRIIGIISAEQTQDGKAEKNDRLLAVAIHSYEHRNVDGMQDLNPSLLSQVEEFFISYNRQRGKKFKVVGKSGSKKAMKALKVGISAFKGAQEKK